DFIHPQQFHCCVERYGGDYKVQHFSTWHQFVCLVFAQLTWRESLRDIAACLNACGDHLSHLGLLGPVKRSTLADALAARDWRIVADLARHLIGQARPLYATEPRALDLDQTIYALDASSIDLGLSVYPLARFDAQRAGLKIHTQLELHSALPAQMLVSLATFQEVCWLDQLVWELGAALRHRTGPRVVCRAGQKIAALLPAPCPAGGPRDRAAQRSHHQPASLLRRQGLPGQTAPRAVLRRGASACAGVFDQSLWPAGTDGGAALPTAVAGRTVLSLAQTTSAHQSLLRHRRQRRAHAIVGGGVRQRAGGAAQKTAGQRRHALRNSPNLERERVRENARQSIVSSV